MPPKKGKKGKRGGDDSSDEGPIKTTTVSKNSKLKEGAGDVKNELRATKKEARKQDKKGKKGATADSGDELDPLAHLNSKAARLGLSDSEDEEEPEDLRRSAATSNKKNLSKKQQRQLAEQQKQAQAAARRHAREEEDEEDEDKDDEEEEEHLARSAPQQAQGDSDKEENETQQQSLSKTQLKKMKKAGKKKTPSHQDGSDSGEELDPIASLTSKTAQMSIDKKEKEQDKTQLTKKQQRRLAEQQKQAEAAARREAREKASAETEEEEEESEQEEEEVEHEDAESSTVTHKEKAEPSEQVDEESEDEENQAQKQKSLSKAQLKKMKKAGKNKQPAHKGKHAVGSDDSGDELDPIASLTAKEAQATIDKKGKEQDKPPLTKKEQRRLAEQQKQAEAAARREARENANQGTDEDSDGEHEVEEGGHGLEETELSPVIQKEEQVAPAQIEVCDQNLHQQGAGKMEQPTENAELQATEKQSDPMDIEGQELPDSSSKKGSAKKQKGKKQGKTAEEPTPIATNSIPESTPSAPINTEVSPPLPPEGKKLSKLEKKLAAAAEAQARAAEAAAAAELARKMAEEAAAAAALEDDDEEEDDVEEEEEEEEEVSGGNVQPAKAGFNALVEESSSDEDSDSKNKKKKKEKKKDKEKDKKKDKKKDKEKKSKSKKKKADSEDEDSDGAEGGDDAVSDTEDLPKPTKKDRPVPEKSKSEPQEDERTFLHDEGWKETFGAEGGKPDSLEEKAASGKKLSNRDKRRLQKEAEKAEREAEYEKAAMAASREGAQFACSQSAVDENDATWQNALDVVIPSFTISAHNKLLFENSQLNVVMGHKYGFVGPNGAGKSTLLKMIASKELKIPPRIDCLYVEQEVIADDTPAFEAVLKADKARWVLIEEERQLNAQLDKGSNPALEERLGEVYAEMAQIGADGAESKARRILFGLGFDAKMQDRPTKHFSGGWRMRISLARALFMEPTLLMLDEPTNHLDLNAVIWLDDYLQKWKKTLLIVSHDQDFLNSVCSDIIHLVDQKLDFYRGNYDQFKSMEEQKRKLQQRAWEQQERRLKQLKASGQSSAKAQESVKKKDRERGARADKKKNAAVAVGQEAQTTTELIKRPREYVVEIQFPNVPNLTPPIIEVIDSEFHYPSGPIILREMNFGVDMDSRICVVGPNGAGKSTLLKLLTGELHPTTGEIKKNPKLRMGIYNQHFVDRLPMGDTPVEYLRGLYNEETYQSARNLLGRFGLEGHAHTIPIRDLSGGQKARVVFSELSLRHAHILFLDEPTNNLDIESIDALCIAIKNFNGGVVVVTHDARLIEACECRLWVVDEGGCWAFEGEFSDYKDKLLADLERKFEEQEKLREAQQSNHRKT